MAKKQLPQLQKARGIKIKIIGLGGGGCSIVSEMSQRLPGVSFVAADTDLVNLQRIKNDHLALFSFGSETTCGLGTGMNFGLGQKVAKAAKEEIKNLFHDIDLYVLIACLGGGVGSGALSTFAQEAQESKSLGIAVLTMPFSFEGKKRESLAQKSIKDIVPYLDARLVLANEKIFSVAGEETSFSAALSLINQSLVANLNALVDIIRQPGLINIDFSDLRAILRGRDQTVFLNSVSASGDNRLESALEKIKEHDFYFSEPPPADKIMLHLVGGTDLKMSEVNNISQKIKEPNPGAQIIFGVDRRSNFNNQIKVTLLSISAEKEKVKKAKAKKKDAPVEKTKNKTKKPVKKKNNQKKKMSSSKKEVKKQTTKNKKVKRMNALDVKEMKKKSEFEKTSQEKVWDIPAFLRRK
jgi:cell division protein FtsZ